MVGWRANAGLDLRALDSAKAPDIWKNRRPAGVVHADAARTVSASRALLNARYPTAAISRAALIGSSAPCTTPTSLSAAGACHAHTLVIGDATRRQVGDCSSRRSRPAGLAGFAEPQSAWRVVGESGMLSRFEALRSGKQRHALCRAKRDLRIIDFRHHQCRSPDRRFHEFLIGSSSRGRELVGHLLAALFERGANVTDEPQHCPGRFAHVEVEVGDGEHEMVARGIVGLPRSTGFRLSRGSILALDAVPRQRL